MPGPGQVSILACQVTHIAQVAPGFTASVHHSTGFMLCKRVEGRVRCAAACLVSLPRILLWRD